MANTNIKNIIKARLRATVQPKGDWQLATPEHKWAHKHSKQLKPLFKMGKKLSTYSWFCCLGMWRLLWHTCEYLQSTKWALLVLVFNSVSGSYIFAQDPYQRLVRRFEMPELGIANPAGVSFSPLADALLVAPSPTTTDLSVVTFAPDLSDSVILATTLIDPVNMAFDAKFNSLLFFDAGADELVEIKAGVNGRPEPSPEAIARFNAQPFVAKPARGITLDPATGDLFFLVVPPSAALPRIVRITPDPEARFDGPTAQQNGRIFNIALRSLSSSKLRGIAFNPGDGHLYIISPTGQRLHELTQEGELLTTRDLSSFDDISSSELTNIQNIVFAPSGDQTDDPAIMNLYIADDGLNSEQGLGDLFELSLTRPDQLELRHLSIDDVAMLEGDNGTVDAIFTVTLSGVSRQPVTVDYATQDATAMAASDYVSSSGTLTFEVGDTSKQIIVEINGDVIEEGDETFLVNLSNARGFVTIADNQAIGTIADDDGTPLVTLSFQDGVNGYCGTRDTKLLSGSPDMNFGSATSLEIDGSPDRSVLLFWDLASIPSGSIIQSVHITVGVTNVSGATYELYELKRAWIEDEATWNENASGQNWQVAGADGSADRGSTVLGVLQRRGKGLHTLSLNSAGVAVVQSWVNNLSANHGFIVQDYINHSNGLDFSSRETGIVSNRPKLTVTYAGEGPPEGTSQIVRGPYLQIGTSTSMTVRWRTDLVSDSRIRYGTDPKNLSLFVDDLVMTTEHELILSGLTPKTKYYYSVGSTDDTLAIGPGYFFVTAPTPKTPQKSRIWVLGDAGTANANQQAVRDAYYTYTDTIHTDLWVMLGDNAYRDGTDDEYQAAVFDMYPRMLRKSVLWPAFGNHDGHSASSQTQTGPFYDIFTLPADGDAGGIASDTEAYYSFDYANAHFICLNSHDMPRKREGEMLTWLQNDLAANTMDWTFAFWHHPPYSKGSHDSDAKNKLIQMRSNALPILEEGGVDLVLTGHSHSYERSFLLDEHYGHSSTLADSMILDGGDGRKDGDGAYHKLTLGPASHEGAVYVVAGSSGKTSGGSLDHPAMVISLNVLGSVVLDVDSNRIDLTFLDDTGMKQDYFTVMKGAMDVPLPVELSSLTASVVDGKVNLQWQTDSEINSFGFEIERFTISNWDSIGFVQGKGSAALSQSYEFFDSLSDIEPEIVEVKYRLKQIDSDGSFEYSHAVTVGLEIPQEAQLRQNYPNPFNPTTKISYSISHAGFVSLKIYDTLGREVRTLVSELQKTGTYSLDLDASDLSSGIYFYTLRTRDGFVQTKKMLFLR